MGQQINLGDIAVDVILKDIKNVHLRVYPPTGDVRISAPKGMSLETIRAFASSKVKWIKRQQQKIREHERDTRRDCLGPRSHYVWGKLYLLDVTENDKTPSLELKDRRMLLRVRPGTDEGKREAIVESWYRGQLREAVPALLDLWEPRMGVHVKRFYLRRMKTRWGSCNHRAQTIRLNTELAKKPSECLEYVVVHELVHLLEPTHNARFHALMDQFLPTWKADRALLTRLPVVF